MSYLPPEAQIAVGYNNAAGLTLITDLSASSIPFVQVSEVAEPYIRGQQRVSLSGRVRYAGNQSKRWLSGLLWLPQWEYLRDTYEGEVTIRTRLTGNTYANYNAVLTLSDWGAGSMFNETRSGVAMVDFVWIFTRVRAL